MPTGVWGGIIAPPSRSTHDVPEEAFPPPLTGAFGLAVAALDALWLSRDWLFALPKWVLIGALGVLLIALGLGYARRQAMMGEAAARMREALAEWR